MAEFEADKVFQKKRLPIFLADMMSSTLGIPLDKSLKAICTITLRSDSIWISGTCP